MSTAVLERDPGHDPIQPVYESTKPDTLRPVDEYIPNPKRRAQYLEDHPSLLREIDTLLSGKAYQQLDYDLTPGQRTAYGRFLNEFYNVRQED